MEALIMDGIGHGRPWAEIVSKRGEDHVMLEALCRFVQPEAVRQVLRQTRAQSRRQRRLPAAAVVWLVIAMAMWRDMDIPSVWRQVLGTLRALWWAAASRRPICKSAFSRARRRLGARPMRQLFCRTAAPLATTQRRAAHYRGMLLLAIDGMHLTIPDTPANAAAFGRPSTRRYGEHVDGAFPQVHAAALMEVGTHLVREALLKASKRHEYGMCPYLLSKAPAGSLVLWDKGFYGFSTIAAALQRGVHVLGRVKANTTFQRIKTLPDGSYLARIYASQKDKRHQRNGLTVRVIEYTIDDPQRNGHGERHRLLPTLLDAATYPGDELVVLYHQRWEFELSNDEIKTHQLTKDLPTHLRSKTPRGVVQEYYGLLLAYNAVRYLMHEAAQSQQVDPRRLSFLNAVRVIRETIPLMRAAPKSQLPKLYAGMIAQIATGLLPPRADRTNARVVKVKMSNYAKKRPEHYHPPPPEKPFNQAVIILK
jgi:hypothetical protein